MVSARDSSQGSTLLHGIGFALVAYGAFSTADAIIKLSSSRFSVAQVALLMAAFALPPVLALTRGQGGLRALLPVHIRLVAARGVLTAIGCHLAWNAFSIMPMTQAYAILFASPMIITACSALLLGEDVGWRRWSATIAGFVGVVIMLDPSFSSLGKGHLLAALAAFCGSASFLILRKLGGREKSASILASLLLAVGLSSAPIAISDWVVPTWGELSMIALAGLLFGSGQAGLVFATRETPAALIAPFQYTQMIWAMVFGIMIFGNMPTTNLFIGLAIVVASGLFIVWRETVRARPITIAGGRGEVTARAARISEAEG
ncbi:MAG: DMT family transporter [Geminicoccaceae bacterium]|nr:DMT family transporter [Geminicoccaceae bacterium]